MISFSTDLRSSLSTIRNQGQRETCLAFAASDAHALSHNRPMADLSAEYAHYHACRRMPVFDPHQGTSGQVMLQAIENDGQPPESEWPYLAALPADLSAYVPPAIASGVIQKRGEELNTLADADAALKADLPVIMGLALSMAFFRLQSTTILIADPDPIVRGTHAVLAVGKFSSLEGPGYLIRNSWGTGWAASGYGLISEAYLVSRILFLGVFRA